jgi:hypothetical protein
MRKEDLTMRGGGLESSPAGIDETGEEGAAGGGPGDVNIREGIRGRQTKWR